MRWYLFVYEVYLIHYRTNCKQTSKETIGQFRFSYPKEVKPTKSVQRKGLSCKKPTSALNNHSSSHIIGHWLIQNVIFFKNSDIVNTPFCDITFSRYVFKTFLLNRERFYYCYLSFFFINLKITKDILVLKKSLIFFSFSFQCVSMRVNRNYEKKNPNTTILITSMKYNVLLRGPWTSIISPVRIFWL